MEKVKNLIFKIVQAVKFFTTTIGQVVGILILIALLVLVVQIFAETVQNAAGMFFAPNEYAGISTTEDYETIVAGIGYAGYDSFISEKLWQEYAAFEYAVLMDVAEHIYENQDYLVTMKDEKGEDYYASAVFTPAENVVTEYDAGAISESKWQQYVVDGQYGNAPEKLENTTKLTILGGNKKVVTPRLIYEVADNEYEDAANSLMPYLTVVREDIELNYFLEGLDEQKWKNGDYGADLKEVNAGMLESVQGDISAVRFSAELNRYNYTMPTSAYKDDFEEDQENENVLGVQDHEGFIKADRYEKPEDKKKTYGEEIYYIEQETDIVYKIPLKILINRYLPKSTLLTSWYMLKRNEGTDNSFDVDDLMADIKQIYDAACYSDCNSDVQPVTPDKKIDDEGNIVAASGVTLRTGEEEFDSAQVQAVQYDLLGNIRRNESGDAIMQTQPVNFAKTNKRTFIYFEQVGLETSMYEYLKVYLSNKGDYSGQADEEYIDNARPLPETASAKYLTKERVNFIRTVNLTLPQITYINDDDETVTKDLPVRLKTAYFIQDDVDEKLKSNYLYNANLDLGQEPPYGFMKAVVREAEKTDPFDGQKRIYELDKENKDDDKATIYDHFLANKYYLIAELGNSGEIEENYVKKNKAIPSEEIEYKLPEDFRYYNQDDEMPHWYDLMEDKTDQDRDNLEEAYIKAFRKIYDMDEYEEEILEMVVEELGDVKDDDEKNIKIMPASASVDYTYTNSAILYKEEDKSTHIDDPAKIKDVKTGDYKINYYWETVYTIQEKNLQMRLNIHHRRMPALLVKYCDSWAKYTNYENTITQNPLNYRNYKYLIPFANTSLGLDDMELLENSKYRVSTYLEYFNKSSNDDTQGIKEADVLDMLVQWEEYAAKNNDDTAYAYMRDLYRLVICIRDQGKQMLNSAYSYLYIPTTISNFKDETTQKVFWLERFGVTQGEDELTEEEQLVVRTKGADVYWQNVEYDEYEECIYDDPSDGTEDANVYALFPYGDPRIRAYYMLKGWSGIVTNDFGGAHTGTDMYARKLVKSILKRNDDVGESIYFYELNRLTLSYMLNGSRREDAFLLAEKELNSTLEHNQLYSPVVAIAPGVVTDIDYNSRSGFFIKIKHFPVDDEESDPQIETFYAHLKRWPTVEIGDMVGAGTVLGYEGNTGKSTGNHLHFEVRMNQNPKSPSQYLMPIFNPFYYDEKAVEILDENTDMALGSEYYTLERTILLEDTLYNANNVINGLTLENGDTVNYNFTSVASGPYKSGDSAKGGKWGNNVPDVAIATSLKNGFMDLNLLNQDVEFRSGDSGDTTSAKLRASGDVTANPDCFNITSGFVEERLKWKKWFAVEMAEYKSERVVPYYNGPTTVNAEITDEEALKDLKAIQDSLKDAGYYQRAGVNFEDAGYGTYSDKFKLVVQTMQNDLIAKGYDKYGVTPSGVLDVITISCYNTMMQYTSNENQFAMAEKTAYNSSVDLSIEPALKWAYVSVEGEHGDDYLALKESKNKVEEEELDYKDYVKNFNREQGLMQISPKLAIERYEHDKVEKEDAVLFIRQPMRNTNIGMEIVKENMRYFLTNYSGDIDAKKREIVFHNGGSGYWKEIYDQLVELNKEDKAWCDPENIDRLILYALGADAYDKGEVESVDVNGIIENGPSGYASEILERYQYYMEKEIKEDTKAGG